jgi:hypothetical protein
MEEAAMPVHVEEMTSEVAAASGDVPLSDSQLERLATLVMRRIEDKRRAERAQDESTRLRPTAAPRVAARDLRDRP